MGALTNKKRAGDIPPTLFVTLVFIFLLHAQRKWVTYPSAKRSLRRQSPSQSH